MFARFERVILIVFDSLGIGALPDAGAYGDAGRDTLGHIAAIRGLCVPNLVRLGLANIRSLPGLTPVEVPAGAYGKSALHSPGKDTTTGHWEMAGIVLDRPFPTYPQGFPRELIEKFEKSIGRKTLGNFPASGTEIIEKLGREHLETGQPIVYTSADSVFQVAAHEDVIPVDELYRICQIARHLLQGKHRVGRVIARPFVGNPGDFRRTERRHDYAVEPPRPMLLDLLADAGFNVVGVGKIPSIFLNRGITKSLPGKDNRQALESTRAAIKESSRGLIFTNLVDFDMLYGHRLDVEGYGRAIEEADAFIPELLGALKPADVLILTADHGCDPKGPSTDHSREYVPVLVAGRHVRPGVNLGTRSSLADIGQSIAVNFNLSLPAGESFLKQIAEETEA
jgi:phosphopentomutase